MMNGTTAFRNFQKRGQPGDIDPHFRTFVTESFASHFIFLPEYFLLELSENIQIKKIVDSPYISFVKRGFL